MKKIIILLIATMFIVSCDESDTAYNALSFPNDAFVAFPSETASAFEATTTPIGVQLNYANSTAAATSVVTVNFTITSDNAVEGTDYMIVDGKTSFEFASGAGSDTLWILPINNFDEDGDKSLTVTITDSSINLGTPGPDSLGKSFEVTIIDDDCAYTLLGLGNASWAGTDNSSGNEGPNSSQIETSFDGANLLIEGIAYGWLSNTSFWDEVVVISNPVIATIDPSGSLTIALQPLCTTTWLGNIQPDYSIQATGTYASCSDTMTINYDLLQGGGILRSYTETIIKN